jgi:6-phosphofructokinase 1
MTIHHPKVTVQKNSYFAQNQEDSWLLYQGLFSNHETRLLHVCPKKILSAPARQLKVAIVTCGGIAPGLNNVIRAIVETLESYQIRNILGIPYGFRGFQNNQLTQKYLIPWKKLSSSMMTLLSHQAGSCLGAGRGFFSTQIIAKALDDSQIDLLFIIGGDGTLSAAHELSKFYQQQNNIRRPSIIGIPKTIDNDIPWVSKSFGFQTAVEKASESILCARAEAKSAYRGIGLVKIMGRHSGELACTAAASIPDIDCVLIPEIMVKLEGEKGLFAYVEKRLAEKSYFTMVVAEGAGEAQQDDSRKPSYLKPLPFLAEKLKTSLPKHFSSIGLEVSLKYIDSSYMQRAQIPSANDQVFCHSLGKNAVQAGLGGFTDCMIGEVDSQFVMIPLENITKSEKKLCLESDIWSLVLTMTDQPQTWR